MRRLALPVGLVLLLIPAFFVLRLFGEGSLGGSLVALLIFYGCIGAGVARERRRGSVSGYTVGAYLAFHGAMRAVIILGVIGLLAPFVYAALTHTEAGNLWPLWGILIVIFGSIAAVGAGLIVYGIRR